MKRTAILDPDHPDWTAHLDVRRLRRLTGHLAARLEEYNQNGIDSVEILGDGIVSARIAGLEALLPGSCWPDSGCTARYRGTDCASILVPPSSLRIWTMSRLRQPVYWNDKSPGGKSAVR